MVHLRERVEPGGSKTSARCLIHCSTPSPTPVLATAEGAPPPRPLGSGRFNLGVDDARSRRSRPSADVHPLVPLARTVGDRGHDVRWATGPDGCEECSMTQADRLAELWSPPRDERLRPHQRPDVMFPKISGEISARSPLADVLPLVRSWRPRGRPRCRRDRLDAVAGRDCQGARTAGLRCSRRLPGWSIWTSAADLVLPPRRGRRPALRHAGEATWSSRSGYSTSNTSAALVAISRSANACFILVKWCSSSSLRSGDWARRTNSSVT